MQEQFMQKRQKISNGCMKGKFIQNVKLQIPQTNKNVSEENVHSDEMFVNQQHEVIQCNWNKIHCRQTYKVEVVEKDSDRTTCSFKLITKPYNMITVGFYFSSANKVKFEKKINN